MTKSVYFIPNGPLNLQPLFQPRFEDIEEYYVQVKDDAGTVIASGNLCQVVPAVPDYVRLFFLNSLGCIDSILFLCTDIEQEVKSDTFEAPLAAPLIRSQHGMGRHNVHSNDTYQVSNTDFSEDNMQLIEELCQSPAVWMQWKGTQGQADDYLPVVISDKKTQKKKADDRFVYDIGLEFKLSNEKIIQRN